jgi:hypothetical protein
MTNVSNYPTATPEEVWAAIRETDRQLKETDKQQKETDKQLNDTDRYLKKIAADFDRERKKSRADFDKELKKSMEGHEKRMKKIEDIMGSWSNNHGAFAEEYFFNSFENGKRNFFGERFRDIEKKVKGIKPGFRDEYDTLLINGKSVAIVEVKYKAHKNDIPHVLKKAETFRINFPDYAKHKIYLGLATLAFYPELEQECINEGIAIVKQVGDAVVINDAHLKCY